MRGLNAGRGERRLGLLCGRGRGGSARWRYSRRVRILVCPLLEVRTLVGSFEGRGVSGKVLYASIVPSRPSATLNKCGHRAR